MIPEFTLTLSPGQTLENIRIKINPDNTVSIIPVITKAFERGDFVVLKDGTFGIIMNFDQGIYQLQWRINKHGQPLTCNSTIPFAVRLATEEEKNFMLDILFDVGKYFNQETKSVKNRNKFHVGQIYYSIQIVNDDLEPVELTWNDDPADIELAKKNLAFKSLEAAEFFISTFIQ